MNESNLQVENLQMAVNRSISQSNKSSTPKQEGNNLPRSKVGNQPTTKNVRTDDRPNIPLPLFLFIKVAA